MLLVFSGRSIAVYVFTVTQYISLSADCQQVENVSSQHFGRWRSREGEHNANISAYSRTGMPCMCFSHSWCVAALGIPALFAVWICCRDTQKRKNSKGVKSYIINHFWITTTANLFLIPISFGFISHVHLVKSPEKELGKGRENLESDWMNILTVFKQTNQLFQVATAWGFLLVWGVRLAC